MNRIVKDIFIAILIVIILWAIFVTIDCIRLRNSRCYTPPIISVKQEANLQKLSYTGLGYTIDYILNQTLDYNNGVSLHGIGTVGAEFRLFGKILIWAYIE